MSAAQRRHSDVRKRFLWWDDDPHLHLLIYPTRDGLKLTLGYRWKGKGARKHEKVLIQAEWAPRDVTEARVVDWARRALEAYQAQELFELLGPEDR